jgi:hypothetical protein
VLRFAIAGWNAYVTGVQLSVFLSTRVSWSLKFEEPIEVGKGKALHTLRDAGDHILALSPHETKQPRWQTAVASLLLAAEKRGPIMMARIAIIRALNNGKAPPIERLRSAKNVQPNRSV